MSTGPVRTCVGCRERAAKRDVIRAVVRAGDLLPDPVARAPGRGAHLHPTSRCLELALRRRAFPRALRVPGPLGSGELEEFVRRHAQTR